MKFITFSLLFIVGSASAGSYSSNLWKKKNVSVCFGTTPKKPMSAELVAGHVVTFKIKPWLAEAKTKVKSSITAEYTAARTGIHFTGWQECSQVPKSDVVLFLSHDKNPLTMVFKPGLEGTAGNLGPYRHIHPDYPEALNYIVFSLSSMRKSVIVHEFGHVAGLDHENFHPKILRGECDMAVPETSRGIKYTQYDPHSVMNYCWMMGKNKDVGLSPGDVTLLKSLYK